MRETVNCDEIYNSVGENIVRKVGAESRRTYEDKLQNGFFKRYMSGNGIDIGFTGYEEDIVPILTTAIGVDKDYPGYNGLNLPFEDNSLDYVYSSHVLEHIIQIEQTLKEWHRVTKIGGHIIIVVPHQYLYEKKLNKPSNWNEDHQYFLTPGILLRFVETSLEPNSYRVRLLEDGDKEFDYSLGPDKHSNGQYEITLVLEKIKLPTWKLT